VPELPEDARIAPLPPEEWPEDLRPLATFTASGEEISIGDLNIFRTLARHPELFQAWGPFGGYLLTRATLPFEEREMLILRTGLNCGSPYEWGQHARIAVNGGMSREDVDRVAAGPEADGWTDRQAALLRAADELHAANVISDSTWAALAAELDEKQLIEVCMLVGQYHLVAFMLNSVGVQPEPGLEPLPES
jgi:4-carboxymuconolactone decarboxylase